MKMRVFNLAGVIVLMILVTVGQNFVSTDKRNQITISGEVIRVGDVPKKDSKGWLFRLVKYKVLNVCQGIYEKEETIVSHFPEPEIDELNVGDKVCFVAGATVGPNINDDWTVNLKGKETHYTNIGTFIKNCECKR